MKKLLLTALMLIILTGFSYGQRDKNYYTQIVRLTDGTELRILPDNVTGVSMVRADDYEHLTWKEYVIHGNAPLDSLRSYWQTAESLYSRYGAGSGQCLYLPADEAWNPTLAAMGSLFRYSDKYSYVNLSMTTNPSNPTIIKWNTTMRSEDRMLSLFRESEPASDDIVSRQTVIDGEVCAVKRLPREQWYRTLTFADWAERYQEAESSSPVMTGGFQGLKAFSTETIRKDNIQTVDGTTFAVFYPSNSRAKPSLLMELPQTLSTTYDFYCVVVPERTAYADVDSARQNAMNFRLYYGNEQGNAMSYNFSSDYLKTGLNENPSSLNKTTMFVNDTTCVDTIYFGRFTMPVATDGLDPSVRPVLYISMPVNTSLKADVEKYSTTLRLAAIIMKPVEPED